MKLKYRNTKISTNTDHRKVPKIMCTLLCGECFTLTNIDSTVQLCNIYIVSYTNIITRIQICLHEDTCLSQGLPNNMKTQTLKYISKSNHLQSQKELPDPRKIRNNTCSNRETYNRTQSETQR